MNCENCTRTFNTKEHFDTHVSRRECENNTKNYPQCQGCGKNIYVGDLRIEEHVKICIPSLHETIEQLKYENLKLKRVCEDKDRELISLKQDVSREMDKIEKSTIDTLSCENNLNDTLRRTKIKLNIKNICDRYELLSDKIKRFNSMNDLYDFIKELFSVYIYNVGVRKCTFCFIDDDDKLVKDCGTKLSLLLSETNILKDINILLNKKHNELCTLSEDSYSEMLKGSKLKNTISIIQKMNNILINHPKKTIIESCSELMLE